MNRVASNMIKVESTNITISLDELLSTGHLPISMFGVPSKPSIDLAISYLRDKNGGSVKIPENETTNELIVKVVKNRDGISKSQFIYYNYRPPVGEDEGRPYDCGSWRVGDIVVNNDLENSDDKTPFWFCIKGGTPGTWKFTAGGGTGSGGGSSLSGEYIEDAEMIVFNQMEGSGSGGTSLNDGEYIESEELISFYD